MAPKQKNLMTDAELELMAILWKLGEGSVSQIQEKLPPERELAYTTVSTIVRILEQKQFVGARKEGRGHVYFPKISREEYEARSVHHMVENVFDGAPVSLARRLISVSELSPKDVEELRSLLDQLEGK